MKRSVLLMIVILALIFSMAEPARPVQAINQPILLDQDLDGISTVMETGGWYNLLGGPYVTNPSKADSDQDGLTDTEEKLFNTNPVDSTSPGISVPYQASYKTFEYYNTTDPAYLKMVRGGSRYLLTEGLVVRRGTTFKVAAVNTGSASLTLHGNGLTALSATRDPGNGGWVVTIPAGGTVGTYSATITNGAWSKSMPIYVIFELPTDLTQAQINAYVYDDDPANKRDEVAVWWRSIDWKYYNVDSETPTECLPGDPVCSNWQYHTNSGYAQAFWTEQFTKKVLINHTLPAIQGYTNSYSAADAIGDKADSIVRINFSSVKNNFTSATMVFTHLDGTFSSNGGACETSAGVYTSMLRSVGIASRPFALDYNKTVGHGEAGSPDPSTFEYDHAVMMWVKSPAVETNRWFAERIFTGAEEEYQPTPEWISGTTGIRPLSDVGIYNPAQPNLQFNKFQDIHSDLVQSVNEGWDFQVGSLGGGMVNTEWTGIDVPGGEFVYQNRDFKWNSKTPLTIQQSPYVDVYNCQLWKGDGWAPSEWYDPGNPLYQSNPTGRGPRTTYFLPSSPAIIPTGPGDIENWPYNPKPTSCSDATSPAACAAFQSAWQAACSPLPGQVLGSVAQPQQVLPSTQSLNTAIQLGDVLSDTGVDLDGDGRYDQLVVNFELTSSLVGDVQMGGWLQAGDKLIRATISRASLTTGLQSAQIYFEGQQIGDNGLDGPYQLVALWVARGDQAVSEQALPEEMEAYGAYTYLTGAYSASDFTVLAASVAGNYTYVGVDANTNGRFDSLIISVPLNIAIPGTFIVQADLYDGNGGFVGHAEWAGSDAVAALEYAVAGTVPPYSLEHLLLIDARGKELNSFYAPVFTVDDLGGPIDGANIQLENSSQGASIESITPNNSFSVNPVDMNANGRYDKLVVSAMMNVTGQSGSYWMEGVLVDGQNIPVALSVSSPQTLNVGTNQTLKMDFDTRMLFDHLPLTGTRQFALIAVKIFSGPMGQATLEAEIPVTGYSTPGYARSQFEPSIPGAVLFQDDLESSAASWTITGSSQWSRTTNRWHSYQYAWMATGSTSKSGLLTIASPLNLTNKDRPWLRFDTAYLIPGAANIRLEVSTNGTTWLPVKTYTGSTAYWENELVDLSAYANSPSLWIRFNALSSAGLVWYIDDVFVVDVPETYYVHLPVINR